MRTYLLRKLAIYVLTFVVAVTLNWVLPRLMPGDPVQTMLARAASSHPETVGAMRDYYNAIFGFDLPIWQQYLNYWVELFRGNLGISVWLFPTPVTEVLSSAIPYTLALMLPSILLSWLVGNRLGALAARSRWLDNTVLPVGYVLTAMPYMWLAIMLAWSLGIVAGVLPVAGGYSFELVPSFSWKFVSSLLQHWLLPFLSLFLVQLGGWAIGMRNLIIYELESDYANYLDALGAPRGLVRGYAFRNAMLPQVTGLALQLGTVVGGALVTEIAFAYPGLGRLILNAIQNQDFFLLQGALLFIVLGVLIANFVIDIVYVLIDPRTRTGLQGATA
ncbi:binding-protein-dependent transport systems inner membrane component [Xylanimonas cellulosilytica DSM 15894]|uniref:Binding-protein-dependent transport systems inner membrane component n=1 Tax=Xylanimonas cellulosilytica (strain DSM 15894 / JCM 12276 / CECT 5975 / KCTC 9989 / LMG 20990 / NBRC 107835 / XIL07) TaxID=446471 RepID=D1BUR1_XYLCX|nr:ABC transporter permease [Xylanimonas cellulosilytica]ACZ29302.1 binding-protein-dependent transport systems inner membrane component [Xylanimonas cellulosilytica DSM 15894]